MVKGEITRKSLITEMCKAIQGEELAAFIGSGLSIPAGYKSWENLLKDAAAEIDLTIENEKHDLVSLAQYYCNARNRTAIDNLIVENFAPIRELTENHKLLAQLPISTFWTTNYDNLIEDSLREYRKTCQVKTNDNHLRGTNRPFDAIVYKMHGESRDPSRVVITRSDYENYGYDDRKLFRQVFEGDLLTKTFIFLGFSFNDSNFKHVIARLRVLLNDNGTRQHFCIMKRAKSSCPGQKSYEQIKQNLQVEDLFRYGISTCLVDEYDDITGILESIVNQYRRNTIFISGSAQDYGKLSSADGKRLILKLSHELSQNGYHLVNGYGAGVGTYVINGVAEYCYTTCDKDVSDILTLMPFPLELLNGRSVKDMYSSYRKTMIKKCGIAIYLFGNKGQDIIADGVLEEYQIAQNLGVYSLPIKLTGGAAEQIYNEMQFGELSGKERNILDTCGHTYHNVDESVEKIVSAVKSLTKEV